MPPARLMPWRHERPHSRHMHLHDWPSAERPREKLFRLGAGALSDAELLALFIGSGRPGSNVVDTARQLLRHHGPLRALLERPAAALAGLPGLGPARACRLAAALELGLRHLGGELERGLAITDPTAAGRHFAQRLRGQPREVFAALFLDTRHRCLAYEELFAGTIDGTEVHPREVVRRALAHNAAALIVAHNHPSGNPEPSPADRAVTRRLQEALSLVDVRLLDHVIVGDGPPVSLAARGWM